LAGQRDETASINGGIDHFRRRRDRESTDSRKIFLPAMMTADAAKSGFFSFQTAA
jgi:hypothetical protein